MMNQEDIAKVLANFKEPKARGGGIRPYILFVHASKHSVPDGNGARVDKDSIDTHVLYCDNALGQSSIVDHYAAKGMKIVKYYLPTDGSGIDPYAGAKREGGAHYLQLKAHVERLMGFDSAEERVRAAEAKKTELEKRIQELEQKRNSSK